MVNFDSSNQKSDNLHLGGLILSKAYSVLDEIGFRWNSTEELCLITLKNDTKFEGKLTIISKNDLRYLVNFNAKICTVIWKFAFWCATFVESILCLSQKSTEELWVITLKNDMQNLKRNWLVLWKMTWGIWRILTQHSKVSKFSLYWVPFDQSI